MFTDCCVRCRRKLVRGETLDRCIDLLQRALPHVLEVFKVLRGCKVFVGVLLVLLTIFDARKPVAIGYSKRHCRYGNRERYVYQIRFFRRI